MLASSMQVCHLIRLIKKERVVSRPFASEEKLYRREEWYCQIVKGPDN